MSRGADSPVTRLSDAEWRIMKVLWSHSPASARSVLEQLESTSWAYTTVKTMLDRLVHKGALESTKHGNVSVYRPCISQTQARRQALRALVGRAFDGAFGSLVSCLLSESDLSERDRAVLAEMLERYEQDPGDETQDPSTNTESES